MAARFSLVVVLLTLPSRVQAIEDPPGCGLANGGNGSSYQSGLNFVLTQAHVGDSVPVFPVFGMVNGACRAVNVTGSVHIATGPLTNFLDNVTLEPGILRTCPCEILITPALVGAGVSSPHGSLAGLPKRVQAVENVDGTVPSGTPPEILNGGFHSASISIVTPALQVVQQPAYPQGQTCFQGGGNVRYSGYVTNAGDITLTNVTVLDNRVGQIQLVNPTNRQDFPANVILPPGTCAVFSNSFTPTAEETGAGSATSFVTATARDTTVIGGPNSFVTNSTTTFSAIGGNSNLPATGAATLVLPVFSASQPFRFHVAGQAGVNYGIQASTNLNSTNWVSLRTNTAPFTFVDSNAAVYPMRFYRAVALP